MGNNRRLMRVKEVCLDGSFSPATFYRLAKKDPRFPKLIKIGGSTRVDSDQWDSYLDALAEPDGEAA